MKHYNKYLQKNYVIVLNGKVLEKMFHHLLLLALFSPLTHSHTLGFLPRQTWTFLSFLGILFYCITSTQRHAKCLELILAAGADVNNIARNGCPLLTLACETAAENEELCQKLLEKGSDPNVMQVVMPRTGSFLIYIYISHIP